MGDAMNTLPAPAGSFRDELAALAPILRRRALCFTKNSALADDLVQDTIERALRFEHTYLPGSNLSGWLGRVMHNLFMTRCRRRQTEVRVMSQIALAEERSADLHQPWFSPAVESALSELPEKLGSVVRLVDLDELSYAEAADELDVPVGTVMSRLHRGRKRLAAQLEEPAARANVERAA